MHIRPFLCQKAVLKTPQAHIHSDVGHPLAEAYLTALDDGCSRASACSLQLAQRGADIPYRIYLDRMRLTLKRRLVALLHAVRHLLQHALPAESLSWALVAS